MNGPGGPSELARALVDVAGAGNVVSDPDVVSSYCTDWTRRFRGPACLVVRPADTEQVSRVLTACSTAGVAVVVQGGNTGLVGGSVPPPADGPAGVGAASGPAAAGALAGTAAPRAIRAATAAGHAPVILSTARMNEVGPVDTVAAQVTAGAGASLAAVQQAALGAGLEMPVDLAARDSATVGGMVATNAGGVHVLRYGGMRRQVIGVEAVLPDGSVLSRLSGLVKDNTGYDLSQLLVGSEGTLGVVTRVRLRLVPHLPERAVLLAGLSSTGEAAELVARLRVRVPSLSAAEIFYRDGMELVCAHTGAAPPWQPASEVYLLAECTARISPLDELMEALADFDLSDQATAVATDPSGIERLWSYRERHTEAVSGIGIPHKLDITVPLGELAEFEPAVRKRIEDVAPGSRAILWGHVGDGNIHVNVVGPAPEDESVDEAVFELVAGMGGSISAEHGIGRAKTHWLGLVRSPAEVAAMRSVKTALDPGGLLNPGVLLP